MTERIPIDDAARPAPLTTDVELVQAVARGTLEALTSLYDRYVALTLAVAQRMLGDRALAEDAVQNLFEQVWRHAHTYDPARGSVRTWLLVRLRSRILNYLRSARVRRETHSDDAPEPVMARSTESIEYYAERDVIQQSLAQLSDPQREVLELAYFGGLSCSEIAARIQIPIGTVKSRIAGGLKKLKQALGPEELS